MFFYLKSHPKIYKKFNIKQIVNRFLWPVIITLLGLLFISQPAMADQVTWHTAATNAHGIADVVLNLMKALAYISGTLLLIASLMKFRNHRRNPQQVTIGVPITEFFVAIALLALPSITAWTWDQNNKHNRYQQASPPAAAVPIHKQAPPAAY